MIFREHLNFGLVLIVLNGVANQLLEALYPVDSLVALILNMPWIIIYSQLMLSGNSDITNVHRLSDRRRELMPYLRVFPLSHGWPSWRLVSPGLLILEEVVHGDVNSRLITLILRCVFPLHLIGQGLVLCAHASTT
jgi:hypothetical protein